MEGGKGAERSCKTLLGVNNCVRCTTFQTVLSTEFTHSKRFRDSELIPRVVALEAAAETAYYVRHTYYEKQVRKKEKTAGIKREGKERRESSGNTDALLARVKCNRSLLPRKRKSREREEERKRNKIQRDVPRNDEDNSAGHYCFLFLKVV